VLEKVAQQTEGFSGRGISKLMIAVQGYAYGKEEPTVTAEEMLEVLAWRREQLARRAQLASIQASYEA
jgi:hypothetical protein